MALEARGVSFSYGARTVLAHVSLAVGPGERVALLGPSGTGKTTLCRVVAGYLAPDAGEVAVDGEPLVSRARRPRPVQLLWQHPEQAFDPRLRLGRSLAEAGEVADPRALALRGRLGVEEAWLDRFPHELSGGELMRLAVARALMPRPRYLVADEATAMLDAITQARLWRELVAIQAEEGLGILLVSHSPALVERVATRRVDLAGIGAPR